MRTVLTSPTSSELLDDFIAAASTQHVTGEAVSVEDAD